MIRRRRSRTCASVKEEEDTWRRAVCVGRGWGVKEKRHTEREREKDEEKYEDEDNWEWNDTHECASVRDDGT